ncbi:MAG: LysM peptidoglycan-binding domain-containing protein [Rickettsiales bacterium]|jgi:hypothetical protein|nr:LysM peptidoglycan-binding domain-containing protein [Rickettsiales bacterium]
MKKLGLSLLAMAAVTGTSFAATYIVRPGETFAGIARAHEMQVSYLHELNPQVRDINKLEIGQELIVSDNQYIAPAPVHHVKHEKDCPGCKSIINGNPLYRPKEGRFYSITSLGTNTEFDNWGFNEVFGLGLTDMWSIYLSTDVTTHKFKDWYWMNLGLGTSVRLVDAKHWKGDVFGGLTVQRGANEWWDSDNSYAWNVGARFGYTSCWWTLDAVFEYDYANTKAFNWDERSYGKQYTVGLEGQVMISDTWNLVASAMYSMPEYFVDDYWSGKIGVNHNFSETTYMGLYVTQHLYGGELDDDTGLALQFGVDF